MVGYRADVKLTERAVVLWLVPAEGWHWQSRQRGQIKAHFAAPRRCQRRLSTHRGSGMGGEQGMLSTLCWVGGGRVS